MAELTVVFWRDIPAQVILKAGRRSAKRPLSDRFQKAIDRAAMHAGLHDTDAYLAAWRRVAGGDCGDALETEVYRTRRERRSAVAVTEATAPLPQPSPEENTA